MFKEFSKKEEKIYDSEIGRLKKLLDDGKSLDEICTEINVKDDELRQLITDDILKIAIAELHFTKGMGLEDIAKILKTTLNKVKETYSIMIEDVMHTINKENTFIDEIKKEF